MLGGRLEQRQATSRGGMAAGSWFNFFHACRFYLKQFACHGGGVSRNEGRMNPIGDGETLRKREGVDRV
jgi:hypothetical protein